MKRLNAIILNLIMMMALIPISGTFMVEEVAEASVSLKPPTITGSIDGSRYLSVVSNDSDTNSSYSLINC